MVNLEKEKEKDMEKEEVKEEQAMDYNVIEQLIEEGRYNMLTSLFVDRPICVLLVGFFILFILSAISF